MPKSLSSRRLIEAGFTTEKLKKEYKGTTDAELKAFLDKLEADGKGLEEYADHDEIEIAKDQIMKVDYPKPVKKYYLVTESFHQSIEPIYFWILNFLQYDLGYPMFDKITDIFTASEHSAFYGASAQRLGLAQDQVVKYLASIGGFVRKDLFQLVRDLRWTEERIKFHEDANKGMESAWITLKGIWTDVVDGVVQGQRVAANVFTMAQQLQFTSLPDFFFSVQPKSKEEVDKLVDKLDISKVVKNVLKRKLHDFLNWKEANYKELKERRMFELKYLRQHYNIIRLYINWIKPYLRHAERLRADLGKTESAELIAAFEESLVEIEVLARRIPEGNKDVYTCILMTFEYRTKPSMSFTQESPGFHRGPVHVGQTKIFWRGYTWTEKQIENYKKMKEKEDFEMLASIDLSIKETMDAIGEDLQRFLKEAGEKFDEEKKEEAPKRKPVTLWDPFTEVGKGFKEMFGAFIPKKNQIKKPDKKAAEKIKSEKEKAKGGLGPEMWQCYKLFKNSHDMYNW